MIDIWENFCTNVAINFNRFRSVHVKKPTNTVLKLTVSCRIIPAYAYFFYVLLLFMNHKVLLGFQFVITKFAWQHFTFFAQWLWLTWKTIILMSFKVISQIYLSSTPFSTNFTRNICLKMHISLDIMFILYMPIWLLLTCSSIYTNSAWNLWFRISRIWGGLGSLITAWFGGYLPF